MIEVKNLMKTIITKTAIAKDSVCFINLVTKINYYRRVFLSHIELKASMDKEMRNISITKGYIRTFSEDKKPRVRS